MELQSNRNGSLLVSDLTLGKLKRRIKLTVTPLMRPTSNGASCKKALGEKSKSPIAHPIHVSSTLTVTLLPMYDALINLPQAGLRFGLAVAPG
jgi:hypothetical protein